jgi:hypothetical protein
MDSFSQLKDIRFGDAALPPNMVDTLLIRLCVPFLSVRVVVRYNAG